MSMHLEVLSHLKNWIFLGGEGGGRENILINRTFRFSKSENVEEQ